MRPVVTRSSEFVPRYIEITMQLFFFFETIHNECSYIDPPAPTLYSSFAYFILHEYHVLVVQTLPHVLLMQ